MRTHIRGRQSLSVAALVALLAGFALSGCGSSSRKLNTVVLERAIAGSILTERHIYTLVSCPVEPQQGGLTFTCQASLTVGSYAIHVTELDGAGHVRYGNQAALVALDTRKVEHSIETSILAQRRLHAHVSCPTTVLQQRGVVFTCTAKVGATSYQFTVTEGNDHGYVKFVGR